MSPVTLQKLVSHVFLPWPQITRSMLFSTMSPCVLHGCDLPTFPRPVARSGVGTGGQAAGTDSGDRQRGHGQAAGQPCRKRSCQEEAEGTGRGREGDRRRSGQWGRQRPLIPSPSLAHGRWGGQEPGLAIPPHLPTPSPAPAGCLKRKP